eukprot:902722-Pelagomonas_calceolata.AAC.1
MTGRRHMRTQRITSVGEQPGHTPEDNDSMGQTIIVLLSQLPAGEGVWSGVRSCLASDVSTVPASKLQYPIISPNHTTRFHFPPPTLNMRPGEVRAQGRIPQAYPQHFLTASFLAPAVGFPTPAAAAGHAP